MKYIKPAVSTFCFGQAASAAAVLLGAGAKGKRFALPHARVLLAPTVGRRRRTGVGHRDPGPRDPSHKDMLNDMLRQDTGQSGRALHKDTDRDFIISATEAVEYGLI